MQVGQMTPLQLEMYLGDDARREDEARAREVENAKGARAAKKAGEREITDPAEAVRLIDAMKARANAKSRSTG